MSEIEKLLTELAQKHRQMILIMKAGRGFSVVLVDQDQYGPFIGRRHFNAESLSDAIGELKQSKEESHDG